MSVSLLIPVEDAAWLEAEAARRSPDEFGRQLTRSDVIRRLVRDARGGSKK